MVSIIRSIGGTRDRSTANRILSAYDKLLIQGVTRLRIPFIVLPLPTVGGDSSVGMVTRYGLDGPGIE